MTQWKWVNRKVLQLLHDESLAEHGGAAGLRSEGLLDSALARPVHLALYENPDFARLAASYGVALAKNHAFVDGNKRVALATCLVFLSENGMLRNETLDVDEWERLTLEGASGALNRLDLTQRLRMLLA